MTVRAATICSGIGAPECARPDWRWIWHAEIEPFPAAVMAARHPGSVNLGDITADDFVARAVKVGRPEVLIGGTPCQSFSVAGLRKSLDDDRGNLSLVAVRLVHELGCAFLWENVPGVLNSSGNPFGCVLGGLVDGETAIEPTGGRWTDAGVAAGPLGVAAWRVVDAQGHVPQRRERVFLLFVPAGMAGRLDPCRVLFEPEADALVGLGDRARGGPLFPLRPGVRRHPEAGGEAGESAPVSLDESAEGCSVAGTLDANFGRRCGQPGHSGNAHDFLIPSTALPLAAGSPRGGGYRNDADTAENLIVADVAPTITGGFAKHRGAGTGDDGQHDTLIPVATTLRARDAAKGVDSDCTDTLIVADVVPPLVSRSSRGGAQTLSMGHNTDGHIVAYGGNDTRGPIEVSTALNAHGGPHGRLDFESETFVAVEPVAYQCQGSNVGEAGTLRGGNGHLTGGVPFVAQEPVAFDWQQGGAESNSMRLWDIAGTLAAERTQAVCFSSKDHGADATADLAPTLRAMPHDGSHANGGGQLAVAFAENSRAEVRLAGGDGRTVASLKTGGGKPGQSHPAVFLHANKGRPDGRKSAHEPMVSVKDVVPTLATDGHAGSAVAVDLQNCALGGEVSGTLDTTRPTRGGGQAVMGCDLRNGVETGDVAQTLQSHHKSNSLNAEPTVRSGAAIRRLTPTECERLQGFPDGWTNITYRGKEAADGPRYKACGNSTGAARRVPAPGRRAVREGLREAPAVRQPPSVWIEGRPYRMGAAYLPADGTATARQHPAPRRLLGYDPAFPWVGGRVLVGVVERTARGERVKRVDMTGRAWAEWAREIAT